MFTYKSKQVKEDLCQRRFILKVVLKAFKLYKCYKHYKFTGCIFFFQTMHPETGSETTIVTQQVHRPSFLKCLKCTINKRATNKTTLSTVRVYIFSASFCPAYCALDLARDQVPQKCPFSIIIITKKRHDYASCPNC